jgi:hypothetical protein
MCEMNDQSSLQNFKICRSFYWLTIRGHLKLFWVSFWIHQAHFLTPKNSERIFWPSWPLNQISSQNINWKCPKSKGKKPYSGQLLSIADLNAYLTQLKSKNCPDIPNIIWTDSSFWKTIFYNISWQNFLLKLQSIV